MKKKVILLVLCALLLLIFTSSSYGGFDPKYKERILGHPWDDMLAPAADDTAVVDILMLRIGLNISLTFVLHRATLSNENLEQLRTNEAKWTKPFKDSPERSPQR